MPGLIKIGYTTRTAEERANELYEGVTGVPKRFEVAHEHPCEDPRALEIAAHRKLAAHRINNDREFFEYPADEAYQVLQELDKFQSAVGWRKWTSHFLTRFKRLASLKKEDASQ